MMSQENFKKMMQNYFSLRGNPIVVEETPDYVRMEADLSIPGLPVKLTDNLHWRRDELSFVETLENEEIELIGYYHRTSQSLAFDQRCFYFVLTGTDGDKYPLYVSLYKKDGEVLVKDEKDPFFPKNKKHDETIDVLEKELHLLKELNTYYTEKFNAAS